MNEQEIITTIKALHKGQMGVNIVVEHNCNSMLPKLSVYRNRLMKRTLILNARLGTSYAKYNEAQLKKISGENKAYYSQPLKGKMWLEYPLFKKSIKGDTKYITINYRLNGTTQFISRYYLNGKEISQMQFEVIKDRYFLKKSDYCVKQSIYGLTSNNEQTKVLDYPFETVKLINTNKAEALKVFKQ